MKPATLAIQKVLGASVVTAILAAAGLIWAFLDPPIGSMALLAFMGLMECSAVILMFASRAAVPESVTDLWLKLEGDMLRAFPWCFRYPFAAMWLSIAGTICFTFSLPLIGLTLWNRLWWSTGFVALTLLGGTWCSFKFRPLPHWRAEAANGDARAVSQIALFRHVWIRLLQLGGAPGAHVGEPNAQPCSEGLHCWTVNLGMELWSKESGERTRKCLYCDRWQFLSAVDREWHDEHN